MTYSDSNDRGNDAWDHDAVCWALEQLGPQSGWTYGVFFECARKQPNRRESDLDRVIGAAHVCGSLGIDQVDLRDPDLGKTVVRLRRTDAKAPKYPAHYDGVTSYRTMEITDEHRAAAGLLQELLGPYEAELVAAGKSRATIHTYVDRSERFLKRVIGGAREFGDADAA